MQPITSGQNLAFVFDLVGTGSPLPLLAPQSGNTVVRKLQRILQTWKGCRGSPLICLLDHFSQPSEGLRASVLKGADAHKCSILARVSQELGIHIGLAQVECSFRTGVRPADLGSSGLCLSPNPSDTEDDEAEDEESDADEEVILSTASESEDEPRDVPINKPVSSTYNGDNHRSWWYDVQAYRRISPISLTGLVDLDGGAISGRVRFIEKDSLIPADLLQISQDQHVYGHEYRSHDEKVGYLYFESCGAFHSFDRGYRQIPL